MLILRKWLLSLIFWISQGNTIYISNEVAILYAFLISNYSTTCLSIFIQIDLYLTVIGQMIKRHFWPTVYIAILIIRSNTVNKLKSCAMVKQCFKERNLKPQMRIFKVFKSFFLYFAVLYSSYLFSHFNRDLWVLV